ncbi:MAG TPA: PD-(D/E)XK nuclease family protein [Silvibacterium sp.]|nr:PD-(D/E)XK nuclease family protein [Silvibacterium sp.]
MQLPGEIESAFESGATVLTANVRAARWLRREYALLQRRAGRRVWATPPIEDWDSWLLRLWQAHTVTKADAPLLLTSLQERSVWMRMQRDDAKLLVSPEGMAALAEEAYALLCAYEAHAERNRQWGQTDAERFRHWADLFDRECAKQGWMSRARLESRVTEAIGKNGLPLPGEILLVGFDRITPVQQHLIAALVAQGTKVQIGTADSSASHPRLLRATDLRDEITACAHWIRSMLEENPLFEDKLPVRIGVLAPDLAAVRSEIERIFRRVLMPETDDIFAPAARMPFEFSLGQPLASVPVIRAALLLLRWIASPLREEEASWLLLSEFLSAGGKQYLALGRFDGLLRNSGSMSLEVPLPHALRKLRGVRFPALEDLRARLESMLKIAAANYVSEEMRTPSRWVDLAQFLLQQAGWQSGQPRGEIDFQARARWERLLDEIALLDFDGRRMEYHEFLEVLELQASETIFAPESHGAPVQIMGALEASGQQFDAAWFLGVDDQSWPMRGGMHPLLPGDLQRRAGMPHATEDGDWKLAQAVTERIAASANPGPGNGTWGTQTPLVTLSYAQRNKDGDLRPSPLLSWVVPDMAWEQSSELLATLGAVKASHAASELEEVVDDSGVITWPREQSAGGASVLKDQAACPFRAFAMKRLNAEELNRSEWGLSAAERGKLLHKVMERIWSPEQGRLHTLGDLESAIANGELNAVIEGAVAGVFAPLINEHRDDKWMEAYLTGEQQRLRRMLEEWLRIEARRVPFTVEACEKTLTDVSVGGLKLKLRADRIDNVGAGRLADGQRLLLDYKSGEVSTADWRGMRPNDPQLPLYAVFGNVEAVCGVVLARIRAGETGIEGCVSDARTQLFADAGISSKLMKDPYNAAMREEWTTALLNLAEEFLRGDAQVDPKEQKKTCAYCPLPGLCRVAELNEELDDDESALMGADDE